jgi:alpha-amylase
LKSQKNDKIPTDHLPLFQGTTTSTSTSSTSATRTTSTSTATSTGTVAITFDETVTTTVGETIKISGSIAALGSWDTSSAIALSASKYTSANPLWYVALNLTPGTVVLYKFINVASSGAVTWESDPNHTLTVPAAAATVSSSWQ